MEIQDYIQTYINYNIGALIVSAPLIIVLILICLIYFIYLKIKGDI